MSFWRSDTYRIVEAMKAAGNQTGVIEWWKKMVEATVPNMLAADRMAVEAWLPHWQVRPFYTAAELAPLFPALAVALGFRSTLPPQKTPARLANELDLARLPKFERDGVTYYLVEHCHRIGEYRDDA